MRSQFMQGFARVSFFGGFLLEKKTLIWGHFLFAPLLEPCENRCSAPPALRLSQMVQFRAQTPVLRLARNCRWSLLSSVAYPWLRVEKRIGRKRQKAN